MCRSADAPLPAVGYAVVVATRTGVVGWRVFILSLSCERRGAACHRRADLVPLKCLEAVHEIPENVRQRPRAGGECGGHDSSSPR